MEADVKVKIAEISMNLLFQHGIPALIKFVNLLVIIPSVLFLVSFPISFNGIGVREGSFILAFSYFGVSNEKALALSFLSYLNSIYISFIGGFFWYYGKRKNK